MPLPINQRLKGKAQQDPKAQKPLRASSSSFKIDVSSSYSMGPHLLTSFKDPRVIDLITDESDVDAIGEVDEELESPFSKKTRVGQALTQSPTKGKAVPAFGLSSKKPVA